MDKNIFFNTDKLIENEEVTISYMGYLFEKGADEVYLHYGFGPEWEGASEIKMDKTEFGFQCAIPNLKKGSLELCFRDGSGEWDNRFGQNFSFPIESADDDEIEVETDVETMKDVSVDEVLSKAQTIIAESVGQSELDAIMAEIENFKSPNYNEYEAYEESSNNVIEIEEQPEAVNEFEALKVDDIEANYEVAPIKKITVNKYTADELVEQIKQDEKQEDYNQIYGTFDLGELFDSVKDRDIEPDPIQEFDEVEIPDDFTDPKLLLEMITKEEENKSLVPYSKGLSKFYLAKKKISLALYKFFRYVPRLLAQNFKEEGSDDE